jgi:hypothetical protein
MLSIPKTIKHLRGSPAPRIPTESTLIQKCRDTDIPRSPDPQIPVYRQLDHVRPLVPQAGRVSHVANASQSEACGSLGEVPLDQKPPDRKGGQT